MIYQVSDLAYLQNIESLDKKINALAEISHSNDVNMASIQDTYTTVDEVNEALANYALKTDCITKTEANMNFASKQLVEEALPNYALKTQINELKAIINSRIEALEPKTASLPEYYQGYTSREFDEQDYYFIRNRDNKMVLDFYIQPFTNESGEYDTDYVLVIKDDGDAFHYLRVTIDAELGDATYYMDELNGNTDPLTADSSDFLYIPDNISESFTKIDSSIKYIEKHSRA